MKQDLRGRTGCTFPWLLATLALGCGTTRMTDTQRTATEQLLISNAVDQAVTQLDFRALAGKTVYFDPQYLDGSVDRGYLISSLRQHMLACGCILLEDRSRATYVVEARSGAIGTDRHSLLVGIPQMTVPTILPGQPSQIPEIPFAKKTDQQGVAKVAVFAYNRETGHPIWQSGVIEAVSTTKDLWVLGTGPFQNGTIQRRTKFAGEPIPLVPFGNDKDEDKPAPLVVPVTEAAAWVEPVPRASVWQMGGFLGTTTPDGPAVLGTLVRSYVAEMARGSNVTRTTPPPPTPPAAPNTGGHAETQPIRVLISGTESKPDT